MRRNAERTSGCLHPRKIVRGACASPSARTRSARVGRTWSGGTSARRARRRWRRWAPWAGRADPGRCWPTSTAPGRTPRKGRSIRCRVLTIPQVPLELSLPDRAALYSKSDRPYARSSSSQGRATASLAEEATASWPGSCSIRPPGRWPLHARLSSPPEAASAAASGASNSASAPGGAPRASVAE